MMEVNCIVLEPCWTVNTHCFLLLQLYRIVFVCGILGSAVSGDELQLLRGRYAPPHIIISSEGWLYLPASIKQRKSRRVSMLSISRAVVIVR